MPAGGLVTLAGVGVAEGVAKSISGAIGAKKDKARLNSLNRPFYKIQDEYQQNKNIADQQASGGLSQASKDLAISQNDRGLGAGIGATLQGGGSPNDIGRLYDQYTRGVTDLASRDSEAHMKNIEYAMQTNKDLAGQKNIQFGVNELQPYEEKLKQLTESLKNNKQNVWGGIDQAIGAGSAAVTGMSNNDLNKSVIGKNNADANYYNQLYGDASGKVPDVAQLPSLGSQPSGNTGNVQVPTGSYNTDLGDTQTGDTSIADLE
jgi:hypothetical protein